VVNNLFFNIVALVILYGIQLYAASHIVFYGALPDLVTIFTVFIAMQYGRNTGMTFGFASGIIMGFLTGSPGIESLVRTLEGFIGGFFHIPEDSHASPTQKRKMFYTAVLLASLFGKVIAVLMANIIGLPLTMHLLYTVGVATLMNMIIAVIAYRLLLRNTFILN